MMISEELCEECTSSKIITKFEQWRQHLTKYYRETYKGIIVSPYHHYQMQVLEDEMKVIDRKKYRKIYLPQIKYLREQCLFSNITMRGSLDKLIESIAEDDKAFGSPSNNTTLQKLVDYDTRYDIKQGSPNVVRIKDSDTF